MSDGICYHIHKGLELAVENSFLCKFLNSLNAPAFRFFQTASSQQNSTDKFQKQVVVFIEKHNNFKL